MTALGRQYMLGWWVYPSYIADLFRSFEPHFCVISLDTKSYCLSFLLKITSA